MEDGGLRPHRTALAAHSKRAGGRSRSGKDPEKHDPAKDGKASAASRSGTQISYVFLALLVFALVELVLHHKAIQAREFSHVTPALSPFGAPSDPAALARGAGVAPRHLMGALASVPREVAFRVEPKSYDEKPSLEPALAWRLVGHQDPVEVGGLGSDPFDRAQAEFLPPVPSGGYRSGLDPLLPESSASLEPWVEPTAPAGGRVALVPRPAALRLLPGGGSSDKDNAPGEAGETAAPQSGPSSLLWLPSDGAGLEARELKALQREYEEVLGEKGQAVNESALAAQIPVGIVAVFVAKRDPSSLAEQCWRLVGHIGGQEPVVVNVQTASVAQLSEWHFAVRWRDRLAVCAATVRGAFRFASTMRQMLAGRQLSSLPEFQLEDWPESYWRGLHLDVVRHYMPVEFIKRYLRAMASFKANVFHWHLTDDQAWRLSIPRRPKLVGSNKWSPEFYTEEDVKEVVDFAASLFIDVLPTIETPGHALAALAAYPELACSGTHFEVPKTRVGTYTDIMCVGKKEVAEFAVDVFTEVARLFPFQYIHVGGDEAPTVTWQSSPDVMALVRQAGLGNAGADVMEAWFCYLGNLLRSLNRTMVMWDDHFEPRSFEVTKLCESAEQNWVVQTWKLPFPIGNEEHDIIFSRFNFRTIASPMMKVYLDYPVASIDYNRTLTWYPGARDARKVLGGCATMWTEDSRPEDVPAKVYPRYLGISERLWGGPLAARESRNWPANWDDRPRDFDEAAPKAAARICEAEGLLRRHFSFSCGKFGLVKNGRNPTWARAAVSSTMTAFGQNFLPEKAVDGDEESYFWAIAPKEGDLLEISWRRGPERQEGDRLGKWLSKISAATGALDRPGDQLDIGELWVEQWLPETGFLTGAQYGAIWEKVADFSNGSASVAGDKLARGPVVAVRILCTRGQVKWMALREITAELGVPKAHPNISDLPSLSLLTRRRRAKSAPWFQPSLDQPLSMFGGSEPGEGLSS